MFEEAPNLKYSQLLYVRSIHGLKNVSKVFMDCYKIAKALPKIFRIQYIITKCINYKQNIW